MCQRQDLNPGYLFSELLLLATPLSCLNRVVLLWGIEQNRDAHRNCLNMLLVFYYPTNTCLLGLLTAVSFIWDFRHCNKNLANFLVMRNEKWARLLKGTVWIREWFHKFHFIINNYTASHVVACSPLFSNLWFALILQGGGGRTDMIIFISQMKTLRFRFQWLGKVTQPVISQDLRGDRTILM